MTPAWRRGLAALALAVLGVAATVPWWEGTPSESTGAEAEPFLGILAPGRPLPRDPPAEAPPSPPAPAPPSPVVEAAPPAPEPAPASSSAPVAAAPPPEPAVGTSTEHAPSPTPQAESVGPEAASEEEGTAPEPVEAAVEARVEEDAPLVRLPALPLGDVVDAVGGVVGSLP